MLLKQQDRRAAENYRKLKLEGNWVRELAAEHVRIEESSRGGSETWPYGYVVSGVCKAIHIAPVHVRIEVLLDVLWRAEILFGGSIVTTSSEVWTRLNRKNKKARTRATA